MCVSIQVESRPAPDCAVPAGCLPYQNLPPVRATKAWSGFGGILISSLTATSTPLCAALAYQRALSKLIRVAQGAICVDILKSSGWSPALSVSRVRVVRIEDQASTLTLAKGAAVDLLLAQQVAVT